MNAHGGVINRLLWMQEAYPLTERDTVLQKTPFSFDVSVWEFFWTLLAGARLVVARPEGHKDPDYLAALIQESGVTTLHFVPSMMGPFLDAEAAGRCSSIRNVFCSGEALPPALAGRFRTTLPQARLHNLYGPTEAAIDVTAWTCEGEDLAGRSSIPIGRPIANTRIYLLDGSMQPVPIGVAGELYIGGAGVARGYLNRPELTAERFVASPFVAGDRLYRTGDLGRYLSDGDIEFLGRNDFQVKIRGYRIELGEIEARLAAHPGVREAVVAAREGPDGDRRLVAYYVAAEAASDDEAAEAVSAEGLRSHLSAGLPEHMVPAAYVRLEALPLTPNGKLDRGALPAPDGEAYAQRAYEAPQGPVEEALAQIWSELLGVERVGRGDNFFELGGHSLLATRMITRISAALGVDLALRDIFEAPKLGALAERVVQRRGESSASAERSDADDREEILI
jgi:acyl-coenzyme A synthetase/AMP-(fatty) acid ligase